MDINEIPEQVNISNYYSIEENEMEFASKNFKLIPYFGILPSNLKLDNILGFIPKHDNSTRAAGTFGLSKEEKASNMVYNWPAWARGIYTTNGTKLELSKYTYSSIEKGLYVAAYRICWFLRNGIENGLPPLPNVATQIANILEVNYPFIASQYTSFGIIQMKNKKK